MKIKPEEIKALRARYSLTQQQLADSLYEVKRERITDWETHRRVCPPMVTWAMILEWDELDIRGKADMRAWEKLYAL